MTGKRKEIHICEGRHHSEIVGEPAGLIMCVTCKSSSIVSGMWPAKDRVHDWEEKGDSHT
jgi:hypothetical protein